MGEGRARPGPGSAPPSPSPQGGGKRPRPDASPGPGPAAAPARRLLLIGYGNPGRGDDGLGPALAAAIAALDLPGVTVDIDYQLTVDHAAPIAGHDLVVFADAAVGLARPFRLTAVRTVPQALGSHQVTPEAALHLAGLLFGKAPPGFTLAIAGTEFGEVREGLGARARDNLRQATAFLADWIARDGWAHTSPGTP